MNLSTSASLSSTSSSSSSSWLYGIVRGRSGSFKMANNSSAAAPATATAGDGGGPVNKKNQLRVMSCSSSVPSLFRYLEPLESALEKAKWSLVQFIMSSLHCGYGTSSLKQDAAELDQLINYLINKEDSEGVILLGHSTGCLDIVHYMRTNTACSRAVRAAILQAPVSDRENYATLPETASMIDLASKMISEGRVSELMHREANPDVPITAYSSELSEDQLKQRLGHMSQTPCQIIFSRQMKMYRIMLTRKHWSMDCVERWVVQKRLKLNGGTISYPTEFRKLLRP